ncbi:MAG: hypothetical protein JXX29_00830 [Deltaproteobacteria bacterium]|nr:hypothetical protein [Deltaproteobacteria bacterium]MBN2670182.1 hypothetical protein [Deltaproteobacteria bacterium]
MKQNGWMVAFFISAVLFAGCGAPYATMGSMGLQYRDFDIQIPSISEHKPRFVNSNWTMENWLEQQSDHTWHRKNTESFKGDVYVDVYANGSPSKVKNYFYELCLDHDGTISSLIVDVTTASSKAKETPIEQMYKTFIDNMAAREPWYAGNRFEKVHVDKQAKVIPGNYKILEVLGYEAVVGYVERQVYDSNNNNADMAYAIFLLKLTDVATLNRTKELQGTKENIPIILAVVLEAEPAERDSLVDDFYEFLEQILIRGKPLEVEYVDPNAVMEPACEPKKGEKECTPAAEEKAPENEDVIGPERIKRKGKKK